MNKIQSSIFNLLKFSLLGLMGLVIANQVKGMAKSGPSREKAEQPNIIVFLADDLGYGDLGCYGHPIIETPHVDKLASEGVRLTDCHSGGTVCSPSRAALLTGRNPYRSGFYYIAHGDTYLKNEEVTLAELLKTEGYLSFTTCQMILIKTMTFQKKIQRS